VLRERKAVDLAKELRNALRMTTQNYATLLFPIIKLSHLEKILFLK